MQIGENLFPVFVLSFFVTVLLALPTYLLPVRAFYLGYISPSRWKNIEERANENAPRLIRFKIGLYLIPAWIMYGLFGLCLIGISIFTEFLSKQNGIYLNLNYIMISDVISTTFIYSFVTMIVISTITIFFIVPLTYAVEFYWTEGAKNLFNYNYFVCFMFFLSLPTTFFLIWQAIGANTLSPVQFHATCYLDEYNTLDAAKILNQNNKKIFTNIEKYKGYYPNNFFFESAKCTVFYSYKNSPKHHIIYKDISIKQAEHFSPYLIGFNNLRIEDNGLKYKFYNNYHLVSEIPIKLKDKSNGKNTCEHLFDDVKIRWIPNESDKHTQLHYNLGFISESDLDLSIQYYFIQEFMDSISFDFFKSMGCSLSLIENSFYNHYFNLLSYLYKWIITTFAIGVIFAPIKIAFSTLRKFFV